MIYPTRAHTTIPVPRVIAWDSDDVCNPVETGYSVVMEKDLGGRVFHSVAQTLWTRAIEPLSSKGLLDGTMRWLQSTSWCTAVYITRGLFTK